MCPGACRHSQQGPDVKSTDWSPRGLAQKLGPWCVSGRRGELRSGRFRAQALPSIGRSRDVTVGYQPCGASRRVRGRPRSPGPLVRSGRRRRSSQPTAAPPRVRAPRRALARCSHWSRNRRRYMARRLGGYVPPAMNKHAAHPARRHPLVEFPAMIGLHQRRRGRRAPRPRTAGLPQLCPRSPPSPAPSRRPSREVIWPWTCSQQRRRSRSKNPWSAACASGPRATQSATLAG
jgi:hypothetical protein